MNLRSVFAAGLVVVAANAFALLHAYRNGSGAPDADITLTNREAPTSFISSSDEDSGVSLNLIFQGPQFFFGSDQQQNWLDISKLRSLGFDCSMPPQNVGADRFYQRQRPRRAFIALELDGPAWQSWTEAQKQRLSRLPEAGFGRNSELTSHLVAIDADLDSHRLRTRHPDRNVIIVPAVVSIQLINDSRRVNARDQKMSPTVQGFIREVNRSVHVPRPFSDEFRKRRTQQPVPPNENTPGYRVHLVFGAYLEPIVKGVEFDR